MRRSYAVRPCARHHCDDPLAGRVAGLGGEQAVGHLDDLLPPAGGVKAAHEPAVAARSRTSTRACCGSATARRPGRSARARTRRGLPIRRSASSTWACLTSSWRSYGSTCHGAPGWSATRRDPVRARLQHLDHPRLGVGALGLADDGPHAVARDRRPGRTRRSRRAGRRRRRRTRASRSSARARRPGWVGFGRCLSRIHASSMAAPWISTPTGTPPRRSSPS